MTSIHKLKDIVQRSFALLGAAGLLAGIVSSALPALATADALNPLTERSLKLSSSSPGWSYKDGSGNATYAPPHSGANGQKTGNEFSFRMSTKTATVKAITFQYCTTPAGDCTAPGDNGHGVGSGTITLTEDSDQVEGDVDTKFTEELTPGAIIVTEGDNQYVVESIESDNALTLTTTATETEEDVTFGYANQVDSDSTSNLNVVTSTPTHISSGSWTTISSSANKTPNPDNSEGNFVLLHADADTVMSAPLPAWSDYSYASNASWTMSASNAETGSIKLGNKTGKNNFITIKNSTGETLSDKLDGGGHGDYFKVIFFGTNTNYITNPGSGAFFVRMNTYSSDTDLDEAHLIDGGVTVANVMNESITIRTKVLETMAFSVGTYDPTLYLNSQLSAISKPNHGQCNTLLMANPTLGSPAFENSEHNVIYMGDSSAENSLATGTPYSAQSYWRLSSNSSGGATVYYTGHTLTNTVGDEIQPLDETTGGTGSQAGTEQFGLAIAHGTDTSTLPGSVETYPVWLAAGESYGDEDALGDGDFASYLKNAHDTMDGDDDAFVHYPRLYPLVPLDPYDNGAGSDYTGTITSGTGSARFAFNANADTYAIPLATESDKVVNCVTAKMRYIANIAATTPAGIYTTKINYVAAPQY